MFAVAARTKDKDMRMAALSAGIGAIVSGVSEPALYGVNLRLRKPMIGLVLGGFIGGSVAGFMGAKAFSMGYSSILGVVILKNDCCNYSRCNRFVSCIIYCYICFI